MIVQTSWAKLGLPQKQNQTFYASWITWNCEWVMFEILQLSGGWGGYWDKSRNVHGVVWKYVFINVDCKAEQRNLDNPRAEMLDQRSKQWPFKWI